MALGRRLAAVDASLVGARWEPVEAPFRDDRAFWVSTAASVLSLALVVLAVAAVALAGMAAAVLFVLPFVAMTVAWRAARASTARTRPAFDSRHEWRDAERRAVAAALCGGWRRRGHRAP